MRHKLNEIQWCPGCWDFLILMAVRNAFKHLDIPSKDRVVVTGIGCSWKISQYIDGYAAETLHGRAIPFATGVKLANSKLTVVVIGWDGDGYGIGLGHFLHACRRNLDLVYIVCNNENYGLTTGQASPTTPLWAKTKTTPTGSTLAPFDPQELAKHAGAWFTERAKSSDFKWLTALIERAIEHPWFAHIDVLQDCPSFRKWQ